MTEKENSSRPRAANIRVSLAPPFNLPFSLFPLTQMIVEELVSFGVERQAVTPVRVEAETASPIANDAVLDSVDLGTRRRTQVDCIVRLPVIRSPPLAVSTLQRVPARGVCTSAKREGAGRVRAARHGAGREEREGDEERKDGEVTHFYSDRYFVISSRNGQIRGSFFHESRMGGSVCM